MASHLEVATDLKAKILLAFTSLKTDDVRIDELHGVSMVDVRFPGEPLGEFVNITVYVTPVVRYGFTIVDKDTGIGCGADCGFHEEAMMLKYMKRLFPLQASGDKAGVLPA